DLAELRVDGLVVLVGCPAVEHAAGAEFLLELGVLGVIGILGLLLGVQVVQVAEELVEPVNSGEELVAVAQVVLAELAAHVAVRLKEFGDRRITRLETERRTWQADLSETRPDRRLSTNERRPPGGARLLAVPVGKAGPLPGDAVDVRS